MDKLPIIKHKKIINRKEFEKLAKKVKRTLEQESEFLQKIKNNEDNNFSRSYFCN